MRFFKLDTGVVKNFDKALEGEVEVFQTGLGPVLKQLQKLAGRSGKWAAIGRALRGKSSARDNLIDGNLLRKKIRLPGLFGNSLIYGLYRRMKLFEARLTYEALHLRLSQAPPEVCIVYNGSNYPESVLGQVSEELALPRVFVEAGFFPGTLQIDPIGLNGANSVPRDPAFYLKSDQDFAVAGLPEMVNNRAAKKTGDGVIDLTPGYVFVPFQVPSDMQVTLHSPWVRDMEMFLDVVIAAADRNPEDIFVIKEHPSFKRSVKGLRPDHPRVIFANDNVTSDLITNSRAVITLNSTVGIEALLLDRPVITLANACYNVEGLVRHAEGPEDLDRALQSTQSWRPDARLRRQYLGYLWNHYLMRGKYDDLPADLADQISRRVA